MPGSGRTLRLVRECRLSDFLTVPEIGGVLEASGVIRLGRDCFVVFDNLRRVGRVPTDLVNRRGRQGWVGSARAGEGYEDIAYSESTRRFYLLIEAEKHPDGTFKAIVEECDERWRFRGRAWVDYTFQKRNTGFEGLAVVRWRGADCLLALCEGNFGLPGKKGHTPGGGQIMVLQKTGRMWKPSTTIKLPPQLPFKDYSAVSLRGRQIAVVSQKSSLLWIGTLQPKDWSIVGSGRVYEFPRNTNGKKLYCTVEGIAWLSPTTFVAVSDLRKKGYPERCARTDQSIHIFKLPGR